MTTNNTELQRRVLQRLECELGDPAASIAVTADDGVVGLAGQVNTDSDKSKAVRAAESVEGVRAVTAQLRTDSSSDNPDDEAIAKKALSALLWYVLVPAELAKVEVANGWITLTGQVEFPYQKEAAEEAVQNLTGVRGVTNRISLKKTDALSSKVKATIEETFREAADLDSAQIEVRVENGRVILSGRVSSFGERRMAETAARSVLGAREIVDELVVAAS